MKAKRGGEEYTEDQRMGQFLSSLAGGPRLAEVFSRTRRSHETR